MQLQSAQLLKRTLSAAAAIGAPPLLHALASILELLKHLPNTDVGSPYIKCFSFNGRAGGLCIGASLNLSQALGV